MELRINVTLFVPLEPLREVADEAVEARRLLIGARIPFELKEHRGIKVLLLIAGGDVGLGLKDIRGFASNALWIRRFARRTA